MGSVMGYELATLRKDERPDDASSKELVNPYKMRSPPKDPGNNLDDFLARQQVTTYKVSLEQGIPALGAKDGCFISRQDAVRLYTTMQSTYQNWVKGKVKVGRSKRYWPS
jgi:hypothetical protein